MLWLCITLPQWPLEALHLDSTDAAIAVTACEGSTRWIICCNPAAERVHLKAPMNYTVALAMYPQVTALERRPKIEQAALERLAAWAYQFSSTVILGDIAQDIRRTRTARLWLEIGASLNLFGGLRKFVQHLEHELQQLHYRYRLGIAPTLEGAALLADAEVRVAITTLEALHARIRDLPISHLDIDPQIRQQLHTAGVRVIGLLLEIPRATVAKRFGPQFSRFLGRLSGEIADPRPVFRLPPRYSACYEFEFEIRNTESLLFPVRRMLREFAGFLCARDTAVQHFKLTLRHRDAESTELRVGMSVADRNPDRLFALVREKLEHAALAAPAIALDLLADQFAAPTGLQTDLVNGSIQSTEDLSHTIDRIRARLGAEHVHGLKQLAEHRPELSWARAEPAERPGAQNFPERPLWLLPEPQPFALPAMLSVQGEAERIESGWWDGRDTQRDYYIVRTRNGADLWIFKNLVDDSWHLHGFWS